MRLIDADALIDNKIKRMIESFGIDFGRADVTFGLHDIEQAPTVEAEPIRHAYWKTNVYASQVVVCSFCNNTSLVPTTYCENCGAKMDKEVEK